jgi:hypothetical protein
VSVVHPQAAQQPKVDGRVPWYVYLAAILLLGWGALVFFSWVSLGDFPYYFWRSMVPVLLEITIGFGLLFRQRWAWVLGVTTAVLFVAEGLRLLFFVGNSKYEWAIASMVYFALAFVILACLLPGRARRVFLGE